MTVRGSFALVAHAVVIWLVCGLTVAIGRPLLGLQPTLWIHAMVAPSVAVLVSIFYFRRSAAATPLFTATVFAGVAALLDSTLVALVFEKSYAMFSSILGTWIPLASIFAATYLTGKRDGH